MFVLNCITGSDEN